MIPMSKIEILYEDEHILVPLKPAGVLSQKDRIGEGALAEILREQNPSLKNIELHPVHRLDRPVSGPLILSKSKRAAELFSRAFRDDKIWKKYIAVVFGVPRSLDSELKHFIFAPQNKEVTVSSSEKPDYKEALLEYKLIIPVKATVSDLNIFDNKFSFLEVKLITGRKHQIRAQLSAIGHPIVGDSKYFNVSGAERKAFDKTTTDKMLKASFLPKGEIALYCSYLSFKHPLKHGKLVEINVQQPLSWKNQF
jgi:23S rRNA pseudouridine1911/1915/1917 synthase